MIYERIQNDIKEAMRSRDRARVSALRYLHSELKNIAINQRVEISDPIALREIARLAKERRQMIEEFRRASRADLVGKEEAELAVLESYLPKPLSEAEVRSVVKEVIQEVGATSKRDMGKVMKAALSRLAGRADGKAVQAALSALLP